MLPPRDDLYPLLDKHLPPLYERDILVITSKVVSIHQGRCVKIDPAVSKDALILREAERYCPRPENYAYDILLTIKYHALLPSAGIDESNGNGWYVLLPKRPDIAAQEIREYVQRIRGIRPLAVVITDSHTIPLRYGTVGIAIGCWGLAPVRDYRGKQDIFGRTLQITQTNLVDAVAGAAVLVMGEGAEQTPLAIVRGLEGVEFNDTDPAPAWHVPAQEDLYAPILTPFIPTL